MDKELLIKELESLIVNEYQYNYYCWLGEDKLLTAVFNIQPGEDNKIACPKADCNLFGLKKCGRKLNAEKAQEIEDKIFNDRIKGAIDAIKTKYEIE